MSVKIEKGVPIPRPNIKLKENMDKLEVGESFRVPIEYWTSLRNAAANYNKRSDKSFSVHKKMERGDGNRLQDFARVWRTE